MEASRPKRLFVKAVLLVVSAAVFYTALSLLLNPRDSVSSGEVQFLYALF